MKFRKKLALKQAFRRIAAINRYKELSYEEKIQRASVVDDPRANPDRVGEWKQQ